MTLRWLGTVFVVVLLGVSTTGEQIWSDDFDGNTGDAPDSNKWKYDIGNNNGWGNNEPQEYTDKRENSAMDGEGNLVITVIKNGDGYTSARLTTKDTFSQTYGKIEARMKLPKGKGIWPAFWMLGSNIGEVPWPKCGEIDIMELRGSDPTTIYGTIHGPEYSGGDGPSASYKLPDDKSFSDDYHVFTVVWSSSSIVWSVDGNEYHTEKKNEGKLENKEWVFDQPFYILLNLAAGGNFDGFADESTNFPQQMLIDYVHVYSL